ncbi:MAG: branched-chain amino acid ABC transporter permease [Gammaproteobacteria bacterium]|nr:branched-chain amino acid ABC transporter permease [Gammaproteobacteria bacterium]MCY4226282.1 branched-chain amino acid ABC transporter permease [Gammaproteobacteria bacterium]
MLFIELSIQGLVQGAIYALIALGLVLVYGLLRILHVAHAALYTLGAYFGIIIVNAGGHIVIAIVLSMVLVGLIGIGIYRFAYKPLLDKPPLIALIASIGLFIAAEEVYRIIFGAYGMSFSQPPLQQQIELFSGFHLSASRICVVILSVLFISILGWLAASTRTGVAWRATVSDPDMAASFGVDIERVRHINFFIGSALAALAGVMVALLSNLVEPTMGAVPAYKALAIIVLGGLGSVRGTLIASLALGIIESFGTIYAGHILDRDAIAFAFLIIVLMIRPQGLLIRR